MGMSLLLGRSLSSTWKKYQEAIETKKISNSELWWCNDDSDEDAFRRINQIVIIYMLYSIYHYIPISQYTGNVTVKYY